MEFKDLPQKVQEIAAQCLADKISVRSGYGEEVKSEPAKEQARQIRDAFIELCFPQTDASSQLDNDQ